MKNKESFGKVNVILLYTIISVAILLLLEVVITKKVTYVKSNKSDIQLVNSDRVRRESRSLFLDYCDTKTAMYERELGLYEEDIAHLMFDNYDTIHLSMWNTPRLDDGTYELFWAKTIFYPQHNYSCPQELYEYFNALSNNEVKPQKVYLSIDPYEFYKEYYRHAFYDKEIIPYEEYLSNYIFPFIENNPDLSYVIILPSLSIEYLNSIGGELDDMFSNWYTFTMLLHWWDNVTVQYMGTEEWLVANSSNYISKYEILNGVGKLAITYIYKEDIYQITPPELIEAKKKIEELCQLCNIYKDSTLAGKKIVFYGDSLFDYYGQSTLTIPGMIQNLTGAQCYNLSIGGTTASQILDSSFPEVAASGVGRDGDRFLKECLPTDDIIFVILYGVNDYLLEASINEVASGLFLGAESLISEYPNSNLLFVSPYWIKEIENEIAYSSYIDAIRDVSRGYHSMFLNLYESCDITDENESEYLLDGIHPKLSTNVMISKMIVDELIERKK